MTEDLLARHLERVRAVLDERELRARRFLGQHFLLDQALLRRIAGAAGDLAGRTVVEVGPGPGTLTAALLEAGARVLAFEIDPGWADFTARELCGGGRLEVFRGDALAEGSRRVRAVLAEERGRSGRAPALVSNLPFQIASPLLVDLVQAPVPPDPIVAMVQREVAERLLAGPGARARGLLTVLVEQCAQSRLLFRVPPQRFRPPPKVVASVLEIRPDPERCARGRENPVLDAILRQAFGQRRKTLRSSLRRWLAGLAPDAVEERLLAARPQELALEDWLRLAQAVQAAPGSATMPASPRERRS